MNPYENDLIKFFNRLTELSHISYQIKNTLENSLKGYEKFSDEQLISSSALVISDWTGTTDNGWQRNYHTGIFKQTYKRDFETQIQRIISFECCHTFAQSFEAIESFFKSCVISKSETVAVYFDIVSREISKNVTRENLPGGDKLFELIKKACDSEFNLSSNNNNSKIKFKEFWTVISECRHAITHSSSVIKVKKLPSKSHLEIFKRLFQHNEVNSSSWQIVLNNKNLTHLIKMLAEFGFQIFKMLSKTGYYNWESVLASN